MKVCNTCGRHFQETTNFCVFCGTELSNEPCETEQPTALEETETPVSVDTEEPADAYETDGSEEPVAEEPAAEEPTVEAPVPAEPAVVEKTVTVLEPKSLLTTAQYFFLNLLFAIPIVGWVFLFVWGCGRPKNLSLKRFALSTLIWKLIGLFLGLLLVIGVLVLSMHPEVQDFLMKHFA